MATRNKYPLKLKKQVKHPVNGYTGKDYLNGMDIRGNGGAWLSDEGCRYYNIEGFADYADFPLIRYYLTKYGVYPSSIQYSCILNYGDFIKKMNTLKKEFYCESLIATERAFKANVELKRNFICFEDKKHKVVIYITINDTKNKEKKAFEIIGVFNPNKDSMKMLEVIKDEIIGLPLIADVDEIGLLNILAKTSYGDGFYLEPKKINKPDIDFSINYNSDFEAIHNLIIERLSTENSKGLVLLHGAAGTGKTTYIRYLVNVLKKRVIYMPPNMTNAITDPGLIKFFMGYPNSVLIIEDAENVLMKRAANATQAIANILNLSDGLLSDCLNMQIVATFNTDIFNIDEALLRKGRLIAKYEFKELEASRVKLLAQKLGVEIEKEHTLADIYNATETAFTKKRERLGFKSI